MSDLFNYKFRKDSIMGGLNQSAEKTSVTGDFTRRNLLEETKDVWNQITGAVGDMSEEYWQMKKHGYVNLDDYHHCKANYKATQRGKWGELRQKFWVMKKSCLIIILIGDIKG